MTEKLQVKDKELVVPGQVLAEGMSYIPSGKAIRDGDAVTSTVMGRVSVKGHVVKVQPLNGGYSPRRNDMVIGQVTELAKFGWRIEIGLPNQADLPLRDASTSFIEQGSMRKYFSEGDYIFAGITDVGKYIRLSTKTRPHRKLGTGNIIEVNPSNVPRIIGRQGSMIKTIKDASGCNVVVGQNGYVWIQGEDLDKVLLVQKAIEMIDQDAQESGLTEKVEKMLKGGKK
jgi:exosome complex component RRP4